MFQGDIEVRVRPINLVNIFFAWNLFSHILMIIKEQRNCILKCGICPISDAKFLL
jgi:hypothetical protein